MKSYEYEAVVRLVADRAKAGSEFTSSDLLFDCLDLAINSDGKLEKRIQKALSSASMNREIVKVRHEKNPFRSGGNRFVWRGTLLGEGGVYCPTCTQKLPVPKKKTKPTNLGTWI